MLVGGRYELTAEVKQFEAELGNFSARDSCAA